EDAEEDTGPAPGFACQRTGGFRVLLSLRQDSSQGAATVLWKTSLMQRPRAPLQSTPSLRSPLPASISCPPCEAAVLDVIPAGP
ncbi:unnamed protein product, partial [Rangifer tarandus platyrhynchus]